jgi:hypothetical protein
MLVSVSLIILLPIFVTIHTHSAPAPFSIPAIFSLLIMHTLYHLLVVWAVLASFRHKAKASSSLHALKVGQTVVSSSKLPALRASELDL